MCRLRSCVAIPTTILWIRIFSWHHDDGLSTILDIGLIRIRNRRLKVGPLDVNLLSCSSRAREVLLKCSRSLVGVGIKMHIWHMSSFEKLLRFCVSGFALTQLPQRFLWKDLFSWDAWSVESFDTALESFSFVMGDSIYIRATFKDLWKVLFSWFQILFDRFWKEHNLDVIDSSIDGGGEGRQPGFTDSSFNLFQWPPSGQCVGKHASCTHFTKFGATTLLHHYKLDNGCEELCHGL